MTKCAYWLPLLEMGSPSRRMNLRDDDRNEYDRGSPSAYLNLNDRDNIEVDEVL